MVETTPAECNGYCVVGRWVQPTLPGSCWVHWQKSTLVQKLLPQSLSPLVFIDGYTLMNEEDIRFLGGIAGHWSADQRAEFTARFVEAAEDAKHAHLAVQLLEDDCDISELVRTYLDVVGLWWLAIALDRAGVVASAFPALATAPHRRTWLQEILREQSALAGVMKSRGLSPGSVDPAALPADLRNDLERHVASHSWYGTHHWHGSAYSCAKALAAITAMMAGVRPAPSPGAGWVPPPETGLDLASELAYWRLHFAEVTAKSVFANRGALRNCARQLGLQYGELIHLSFDEVMCLCDGSRREPPTKAVLGQRFQGYFCRLADDGRESVVSDPIAVKEVALWALAQTAARVRAGAGEVVLQGSVACRGPRIRGVVELIADPTTAIPVGAGADLLVTYETTPDFVPLLNGYRGVVTQMGGVTSHAAVICRELGIPCIVGAEGVADVVAGGMWMDADFSTGEVRVSGHRLGGKP